MPIIVYWSNMTFEDPKKEWEIDHDWKYIGVSNKNYYNSPYYKFKTYKCSYCESFYFGEGVPLDTKEITTHEYVSPFRPKDSGCQIIYALERSRNQNKELKEELSEYENAFKTINLLLNRNKNDTK